MKKIFIFIFCLFCVKTFGQINAKIENLVRLAEATTDKQQKIQYLSDAIDLAPDKAGLYKSRGEVHVSLQHSHEAIEDFDKALALDPKLFVVFVARGQAKYDLGLYDETILDCSAALNLDSTNALAYRLRAHTKKQQALYESSLLDYNKSLFFAEQQKDNNIVKEALNGRGNVYYYLSRYLLAKSDFSRAVEIDAKNYYGLLKLGIIYFALQSPNDANKYIDKAIPMLVNKKKYDLLCEAYIVKGDILATATRSKKESQIGYEGRYERKSIEAITAGGIEEVEDGGSGKKSKHSPFTEYLLKALTKNTNQYYDSSDLYDYLKDAVPANTEKTHQIPLHGAIQSTGDEGGKFIFTRKK